MKLDLNIEPECSTEMNTVISVLFKIDINLNLNHKLAALLELFNKPI